LQTSFYCRGKASHLAIFCNKSIISVDHCLFTAGLIPRSLLRKELFPDLLESVIPECFYRVRQIGFGRIRPSAEIQARTELDPRLKHSGVTPLGEVLIAYVLIPRQLAFISAVIKI